MRRGEDECQVLEAGQKPGVSLEVEWSMSGSDEERTSVRYSGRSARGMTDTSRSDEERRLEASQQMRASVAGGRIRRG